MKVLLVTGSFPPDVCGTAEYSMRLSESLNDIGLDTMVFHGKQWGLAHLPSLLKEVDALNPDVIHIQYPTTGYGYKLGPQGIGALRSSVVTLHEASQAHLLRQISLCPFVVRSRQLIFTNEFEKQHVARAASWITRKSTVIPIGSNILVADKQSKRAGMVTYFGIIRPEKGLEDVLEAARLLQQRGCSSSFRIVGALMPRWMSYYEHLRSEAALLPIEWHIGLENHAVSRLLSEASIAYLPFPDGSSERRSSLIAMLMNRACVLTTIGAHTPASMIPCIVPVRSVAEAVSCMEKLFQSKQEVERIGVLGAVYAKRFSWERIAHQHLGVYEKCLP